VVPIVA
jgi:hypothetical protein